MKNLAITDEAFANVLTSKGYTADIAGARQWMRDDARGAINDPEFSRWIRESRDLINEAFADE